MRKAPATDVGYLFPGWSAARNAGVESGLFAWNVSPSVNVYHSTTVSTTGTGEKIWGWNNVFLEKMCS